MVNDTIITITLDRQEAMVLPNHTLILNPGAYPIMVDGFVVSSSDPTVAVARIMNNKTLMATYTRDLRIAAIILKPVEMEEYEKGGN